MSVLKVLTGKGIGIGGNTSALQTAGGGIYQSAETTSIYEQTEMAEVIDIDISSDVSNLGRVKFRFMSQKGRPVETLDWAYPMNSSSRVYPIKHETVAVIEVYGRFYYDSPLNYSNFVNNNALENVTSATTAPSPKSVVTKYTKTIESGIANSVVLDTKIDFGLTFKDSRSEIPALQPNEGDVIHQGRFGNYIRLGNNSVTNSPNIKISIIDKREKKFKIVSESLDNDSCIWMTTDELIQFKRPSTLINSANNITSDYKGNNIIISSDRLVLNAKSHEMLLFGNKGIHLAANKNFSVDSGELILINSKSNIELNSLNGKFLVTSKDKTIIKSPKLFFGTEEESQPMVLGKVLYEILDELLRVMVKETHIGFSGPPTPDVISQYEKLRQKLKKILSSKNFGV